MPFCSSCGKEYTEGTKFCPDCGAPINSQTPNADTAPDFEPEEVFSGNKTRSILAVVFPFLFFLPLISDDKNYFDRFWANQSLLLFLMSALSSIIPVLGYIIGLFDFICWIIALINVCKGKCTPIPLVGKLLLIK